MKKIMQRMLSGLMCLVLLTGSLPVIAEEAAPTPAAELVLPAEPTAEPAQELPSAEPTEAASVEPTEAPAEVPAEIPADATPVPGDENAEAAAEATAIPEITEAPVIIDYTADAGKSPAFVIGYAQAPAHAIPVYESADASAAVKAELGENSVVYAIERASSPDRLHVYFNANPLAELDSGWVDAAHVRPLEPTIEVPSYLAFCQTQEGVNCYAGDPQLPLNWIACTYAQAEATAEPTAEVTVEPTVEITAEPTVEVTAEPTAEITVEPTAEPTVEVTAEPTVEVTVEPTVEITTEPTMPAVQDEIAAETPEITAEPTPEAAVEPTLEPAPETDAEVQPEGDIIIDEADMPMMMMSLRAAVVDPTDFSFNTERLKLGRGNTYDLVNSGVIQLVPENALATYTFKSENKRILTVDESGIVTAVAAGKTRIQVVTHNGISKLLDVTVYNAPKSISMKPASAVMGVNDTLQLKLTLPSNTYSLYSVASSNPFVASVDNDGLVTAHSSGSATITVTTQNGKSASTEVTVMPIPMSISASEAAVRLGVGQVHAITGVYPEGTLCGFIYASDNPGVVQAAADGTLTAIAKGAARITISATNSAAQAYCDVTVEDAPADILLDPAVLTLGKGNTYDLVASGIIKTLPEGSCAGYTFKTSNKNYVAVDANGIITAKYRGSATITITSHNGISKKLKVTVMNAPSKVTVSPATLTLGAEMTGAMSVAFPRNTYSLYSLVDYDPAIISVDAYGNIRALQPGTTTATVLTANGKSAGCTVTVLPMPTAISAQAPTVSVAVGQTGKKVQGAYPEGTMCDFTYVSTNEAVAKVDPYTGEITAIAQGEAKIIITSKNSVACTAECIVQVVPAPESLAIGAATLELGKGNTYDLLASGFIRNIPEGSSAGYSFKSSNKNYVSVDANGVLTAKRNGTITITVTTHNGLVYKFKVKVMTAPSKVTVSPATLTLGAEMKGAMSVTFPRNTYSLYSLTNYDPNIISVDSYGNITALNPGTTTATVLTANGKSAGCTVTVLPAPSAIYALNPTVSVAVGQTGRKVQGVYPEGTMCDFTYASTNEAVAKVDPYTGEITAIAQGEAKIIITSRNSVACTAECTVQVVPAPEALAIGAETLQLGRNNTYDLLSSGFIKNIPEGSSAGYSFKSSNKSYVSVDENGILTAKRNGTVTITVSTHNGLSYKFKVKVMTAPSKVTVSPSSLILGAEMKGAMSVTFPKNTYSLYSLTDYDPNIISVDSYGNITALNPGTTTATVLTANGKSAGCTVTVLPMPASISAQLPVVSVAVGQTGAKVQGAYPAETMCEFTYASTNEAVAKVDPYTGEITAIAQGEAKVIITSKNSVACTAECTVQVVPAPEALALGAETLQLGRNNAYDLLSSGFIKNIPEGSSAGYTFKSSNKNYVSVDENGILTAKRNGTVTITVTTHNGLSYKFKVKVMTAPSKVTVSPENLTLGTEMKGAMSVTFPKNTYSLYSLTNYDPNIISVDAYGNITALNPGTTTAMVLTANGKSAGCTVTVLPAPSAIYALNPVISMAVGQTGTKAQGVYPEGTMCDFTYASTNEAVAKVDPYTGEITALAQGEAKIIITSRNSVACTAECTVQIVPAPDALSIGAETLQLGKGNTYDLLSSGFIKNVPEGSSASYSFKSSNKNYVSVDANGVLTAKRNGTITITVTAHNGVTAKFKVKVMTAPSKVTVSPATLDLGVGMTGTMTVSFPKNTYSLYDLVDYDPSIISVDAYGRITALREGSTTATVITKNGKTAGCSVNVLPAPQSVSMTAPSVMGMGQTGQISLQFAPANSLTAMSYSVVSGNAVAVDAQGKITTVAPGTAVVRASTHVPGVYADCTIEVKPAPETVYFDAESYTVYMGTPLQLKPVMPEGSATNLTYTASKNNFFTVDQNGLVTPIQRGSGTVTVTTHNGLTASAKILVVDPYYPEAIELAETPPAYMDPGDTYKPVVSVFPASAQADLVWTSSAPDVASVESATGLISAHSHGRAVITGQSFRNPSLSLSFQVVVLTQERTLKMPARRTGTSEIASTLSQIKAVRQSAYNELEALYLRGTISKSDYNARKGYIERAFDMHLLPWMTKTKELYWKAANSEGGLKDYTPGTVYYGLPYTQTNRNYNKTRAIDEGYYTSSGSYYLWNTSKFTSRNYPGNDCSSFASMAIWGTGSKNSYLNTRSLATTSALRTIDDWTDLRPGDLLNKSGNHVVMFLYYANDAKTQIVIIEQGGGELETNTISCSIRDVEYYTGRGYKIRRVASLG